MEPTDPQAAIAARVAMLEEANAALMQRVTDVEQLHTAELAEIRGAREQAARETDGRAAVEDARDKERQDALAYLAHHESAVRFPLGSLRDVLKVASAVMASDAAPLRRALPRLEQDIERLRAVVQRDPWPEGEERLHQAEAQLKDAVELLVRFDERMAAQEAARAARSGAAR